MEARVIQNRPTPVHPDSSALGFRFSPKVRLSLYARGILEDLCVVRIVLRLEQHGIARIEMRQRAHALRPGDRARCLSRAARRKCPLAPRSRLGRYRNSPLTWQMSPRKRLARIGECDAGREARPCRRESVCVDQPHLRDSPDGVPAKQLTF